MANWVRYPLPFSERFPLGEHAKWRCDTPPLKRGISAILARYPMKTRQIWVRDPPLRYYLERVLRDMGGGISHWAAKHGIGNYSSWNPTRSPEFSGRAREQKRPPLYRTLKLQPACFDRAETKGYPENLLRLFLTLRAILISQGYF